MNTVEKITPTSLEISFIETLIFYTCLDAYDEAIDSKGNIFQKTREGSAFIKNVAEVLWKIADNDPAFEERISEYEDLLKQANSLENEPLTIMLNRRVDNFRTVNHTRKGGDTLKS